MVVLRASDVFHHIATLRLMRLVAALIAGALVALVAPAAAQAKTNLWATVNVCDTPKHPNEVGVRASMPGAPRRAVRRMRFRIQYRSGDRWRYVTGADSGWSKFSRARGRPVEAGWSFVFPAPDAGPITFRGVVRYRWLRHGRVVEHALRITEAGHSSTTGSDPEGYSAATCSIG
jgi:hypothetical protein